MIHCHQFHVLFIILTLVLLPGCGLSPADQTATAAESAAQTQAAIPTATLPPPTSTPLPTATPTELPTLTPTPTPTPSPTPTGGGRGTILYASVEQTGGASLKLISADGGSPVVLFTIDEGSLSFPSWSPDGSQILFMETKRGNEKDYIHSIFMMDANGENLQNLIPVILGDELAANADIFDALYPSMSPDGRLVLFSSNRHALTSSVTADYELFTLDLTSGEVRQLTDSKNSKFKPVYSPDGTRIAFTSNETGENEIFIMNADGSDIRNLTHSPETEDLFAAWSPDGSKLVFHSFSENLFWIKILDLTTMALTTVVEDGAQPSFSADGQWITFFSARDGEPEIFIVRVAGSELTQLTDDKAADTSPVWAP